MRNYRKGALLIGLLLFFTVLALSSTVGVLERDTRLKRFTENDLRANLGAIRRAIELYRYKYTFEAPDSTKILALETALNSGVATEVAAILANESFVRARVATGSMKWQLTTNLIKNPSFEVDDNHDYGPIGASNWRGNFTANDGVPNGWNLNSDGLEQIVPIAGVATYVVSFWAKCNSASAGVKLKVWIGGSTPACELTVDKTNNFEHWRRYFGSFQTTIAVDARIELVQAGCESGANAYVDGVMLEEWTPPAGLAVGSKPVPSAWTKDFNVTAAQASQALQIRTFKEMTPPAGVASYSWWFQW